MINRAWWATAAVVVAIGCGGGKDTAADTANPPTDTVTDTDTDSGPATDGVSPYVVSGSIYCENTGGTSKVDTWFATVLTGDPQGTENLASFGSRMAAFTVAGDAEVYNDMSLVCDADGACTGSVNDAVSGIPCASGPDFYWAVEILDDDGNVSPWTVLDQS